MVHVVVVTIVVIIVVIIAAVIVVTIVVVVRMIIVVVLAVVAHTVMLCTHIFATLRQRFSASTLDAHSHTYAHTQLHSFYMSHTLLRTRGIIALLRTY